MSRRAAYVSCPRVIRRLPLLAALLWLGSSYALSDNPCALLLGGFREDCLILAANNKSMKAKPMMPLYAGDKIVQKSGVGTIVIKCSSFTSVSRLDETTLQIVYRHPPEKRAVLGELASFLGFERNRHESQIAGTRAVIGDENDVFFPQPGGWATVLPGEPISFVWDRKGIKTIVIRDSSGVETFSKGLGSGTSMELTPEEIKMKPAETYYWQMEIQGVPRSSETLSIRLLDKASADLVNTDLKRLGEGPAGASEKMLRMAAYCQFISDTYTQEIDLYWKSYQLLREIDQNGIRAEERGLWQMLRDRYVRHIQEQMTAGYR